MNITGVAAVGLSTEQVVSLVYTVPFHYVGEHDKFLGIAREANDLFVTGVADGNFTSVLRRKSVEARVSVFYNVSSSSVVMVDVGHTYHSPVPTSAPTAPIPEAASATVPLIKQSWVQMSVVLAGVVVLGSLLFCLGLHWRAGSAKVAAQVELIRKTCLEPKPDDLYVESSSDEESELFADDEVYKY